MAEYNWLLKFSPIEIFFWTCGTLWLDKIFTSLQMPPQDLFTYTKILVYLVGKSWNLIFMLFFSRTWSWLVSSYMISSRKILFPCLCVHDHNFFMKTFLVYLHVPDFVWLPHAWFCCLFCVWSTILCGATRFDDPTRKKIFFEFERIF